MKRTKPKPPTRNALGSPHPCPPLAWTANPMAVEFLARYAALSATLTAVQRHVDHMLRMLENAEVRVVLKVDVSALTNIRDMLEQAVSDAIEMPGGMVAFDLTEDVPAKASA